MKNAQYILCVCIWVSEKINILIAKKLKMHTAYNVLTNVLHIFR